MGQSFNVGMALATLASLLALAAVALSFATDYWIVTTVDRRRAVELGASEQIMESPIAFSRHRGLFRICYEGKDTYFLDDVDSSLLVDGNCIYERGYEIKRRAGSNAFPTEYDTRMHLMRSHFMLLAIAIGLLPLGAIFATAGCCRINAGTIRAAAAVYLLSAFFTVAAMAFFHGYESLEQKKLDNEAIREAEEDFPAFWKNDPAYSEIAEASKREFGWSYMLGWIGGGLALIAGSLTLWALAKTPQANTTDKAAMAYANFGSEVYAMPPINQQIVQGAPQFTIPAIGYYAY